MNDRDQPRPLSSKPPAVNIAQGAIIIEKSTMNTTDGDINIGHSAILPASSIVKKEKLVNPPIPMNQENAMQRKLSSTGRMMEPLAQGVDVGLPARRDSGANRILRTKLALRDFLDQVKDLQEDMRKESQRQIPYQVFLSYAWGNAEDVVFKGLKSFLRNMYEDLTRAGTTVWFDEKRMTGAVEAQMHDGIVQSDLVLLFGTDVYRSKTQAESKTNVKKELDFALQESQQKPGLLKPLLFEGTFKETFSAPGLAGYTQLMVDATWVDLSQEDYDMQKYVKTLTTYDQEVGILPAAIGLPDAPQRYKLRYQTAEQVLQMRLNEIYMVAQAQSKKSEKGLVLDSPRKAVQGQAMAGGDGIGLAGNAMNAGKNINLNPISHIVQHFYNNPPAQAEDSKESPEEIAKLTQQIEELEKKKKDLLASTLYNKLPAVKNKEELDERIKEFSEDKERCQKKGKDFPEDEQAYLDLCEDIAKQLPKLNKQIQAIEEKIQMLEYGPSSVVQGDIDHQGDITVEGPVEIGHDAKGKQGNVRQGNISMQGNVVNQSGGFRLGHSA